MVMDALDVIRDLIGRGERATLATPLDGSPEIVVAPDGEVLAGSDPGATVLSAAAEVLRSGAPLVVEVEGSGWFVEPIMPAPRLLVFGAIAVADALVPMAAAAGFDVEVVDQRPWLASRERYPDAVEVHCGEPIDVMARLRIDSGTCIVSFLHEPRLEDPVLVTALTGPAAYIGAMGSGRTTAAKRDRLAEAGVPGDRLERLHAPIGLDIGAVTPQEIAVAVLAEIVAVRRGVA